MFSRNKSRDARSPKETRPKTADPPSFAGPGNTDPYTQAQLVDIAIASRALRSERKSSRVAIWTGVLLTISLLGNVVALSKDHTSALVYRDDAAGHRTVMGYAGANITSSTATVESELRDWVALVREVPSNDLELATQNENNARLFVARGSSADQQLQTLFAGPSAPDHMVKKANRLVLNQQINKLTDLTYQIIWTERSFDGNGAATSATYQGTVTLSAIPVAPSDPVYAQINPAGVFIASYNLEVPST